MRNLGHVLDEGLSPPDAQTATRCRCSLRLLLAEPQLCHLCPTWRHSLEIRACRLAMPEEIAKIGGRGT